MPARSDPNSIDDKSPGIALKIRLPIATHNVLYVLPSKNAFATLKDLNRLLFGLIPMASKKLYDAEMYEGFKKRYGGHTTAELRQRHASLRTDRQIAGKTSRQVLTQQLQMLDQLLKEKGAVK